MEAKSLVIALVLLLAVSSQAALLRRKSADPPALDLDAEADQLHKSLTDFLKNDASGQKDEHNFGQTFMSSSQRLLAELTEGKKNTDKVKLAERLVADLKLWANHTTQKMADIKHKMAEDDANYLLKLLVERQHLPMATQLAILKRKDIKDRPWALRLLKEHKESPSLAEQFRAILATEAKDLKVKVGKKIAIDHSKQGDKLREVQKKVGEMQGQVTTLVTQMEAAFKADPELSKDPKANELLTDAKATVKRMETDILKKKLKDLSEVGHDLKSLEKLELAKKATKK